MEDEIYLTDAIFQNASSEDLLKICKSWNKHEQLGLKFSELRTNQIYVSVIFLKLNEIFFVNVADAIASSKKRQYIHVF